MQSIEQANKWWKNILNEIVQNQSLAHTLSESDTWWKTVLSEVQIITEPVMQTKMHKRGANDDTTHKLEKLRKIHADCIKANKPIIKWTVACQQAGIDPKTAKKHAPELRKHWENREIREL